MSISIIEKSALAVEVLFEKTKMIVILKDGRELAIPLEWFPLLRNAELAELRNYRFIGDGEGIHWPVLDEDVLVSNLL